MKMTPEQVETMASAFQDELCKIAAVKKQSTLAPGSLIGPALGAAGMYALITANRDRQMGRQIRLQQGNY